MLSPRQRCYIERGLSNLFDGDMSSKQTKEEPRGEGKLEKQLLILEKKLQAHSSTTISILLAFNDYQVLESKKGFWSGIINFSTGFYASAILTFYTYFQGLIPIQILQIATFLFVIIVLISLFFIIRYQGQAKRVSKQMEGILEILYGSEQQDSR